MPSGSRGGHGGSHGGSRSGGFRSSGSSGSHGGSGVRLIVHTRSRHSVRLRSRRPGAPVRYFDLDSLHGIICGIIAIFFMIFGSLACSNKENVDFLREDYAYYQNMIVQAEIDPDYMVDAKVTSCSYHSGYDKVYINYAIPYTEFEFVPGQGYQDVTKWLYGYSFSVYTQEEAEALLRQGTIKVAVDSRDISSFTDSVPMDYKNMPIEQDGEYKKALRDEAKSTTILIVLAVITAGWFTFFIITTNKLSKDYDKKLAEEKRVALEQRKKAENNPVKESNYCEYCGTYMVKDNNIKCPACGATKKIKN